MVSTDETTTGSRRLPGVEGVWVFVAADMAMFCFLFASYMKARAADPVVFEASRQLLEPTFGGVNTLILLTSSWFVVLAVQSAQQGRSGEVSRWLAGGFACGVVFTVSKATEYTLELASGHTAGTNGFFMYYFSLTGLHLAHVIAGTIVLGIFWKRSRQGVLDTTATGLESGATFWHMVDFLWVVIFPLLYLVR